jgi:hypothetical protein
MKNCPEWTEKWAKKKNYTFEVWTEKNLNE